MQIDAGGLHSVVGDVSTLNSALESLSYSEPNARHIQDAMACFPLPLTLEEAVNTSVCGQLPSHATIATSAGIWNLHSGSDTIKDCFVGTSYPFVKNIQDPNLFMDGIPISGAAPLHTLYVARYGTFEDQEKLTNLDSSEYPPDSPYRTVPDHLPVEGSSFETTKCCYDGSLNTSTKFDVSKFVSPELFGKVVERNGSENSAPNRWILSENTVGMDCSSPVACHNGLSLSLSTCQPCRTPVREHCSELPTITSYCSYRKHIRSEQMSCSSSKQSLNFKSYKPLQLSLLSESKFSHAMQEILAEMACYLLSYSSTCIDSGINASFSSHCPSRQGFSTSDGIDDGCRFIFQNKLTLERSDDAKKKHLLDLLQVVDDQYNQCLDEVHTVIAAFHAVTQLDPNLHARFALPTIASMYKNLRERISCHILEIGASCIDASGTQEEKSFETLLIQKQWALQQLRKRDPQLWRPQRGLPERSVSVLRAWMFQNFLHPYPKDAEKHLLALKSGLTRSQVSNWFINARVRLWKPMIEEMYAEMNRSKARRIDEESNGIHKNHVLYKDRDLP